MNKLVKLLNEWEELNQSGKIRQFTNKAKKLYRNGWSYDTAEVNIISKKFGFIKWLIDNDKIDRVEVWSTGMTKPTYGYTTEPYTTCKSIRLENTILMVLSIQDKPIEFLCSILK